MKGSFTTTEQTLIRETLAEMQEKRGRGYANRPVNLAELTRRTGITRSRLRRLQRNNFEFKPHGNTGRKASRTVLTGYTEYIDEFIQMGVYNSTIILDKIRQHGYQGGRTAVKDYIAAHRPPRGVRSAAPSADDTPAPDVSGQLNS